MANSMFDQFKLLIKSALQDEDFRRKNSILQDDAYIQGLLARVTALDASVIVTQDFGDVISVLGMLEQSPVSRSIKFDTRGFLTTLSAFREGMVNEPENIWRRNVPGSPDRYLVSDRQSGVLVLNEDVEVLYRFPGFGANLALFQYNSSSGCTTFTIGTTEYIAITMYSHHICSIYEYNAPYSHQATIGQIDTPGDIANYLSNPKSVAVDETNSRMYILNQTGQPVGATQDRGYVAVYDISVPATPVFVEHILYYVNSGSLLDVEATEANDIMFFGGLLWITNGNNEVGAIDVVNTPNRCSKYIEPSGPGYTFRSPEQVSQYTSSGGYQKIYIANGSAGTIEVFDGLTLRHEGSYGYRASEDELSGYNRMSSAIYGAVGYAKSVVADIAVIDEKTTNIMICGDTLNKRLHRFNLDAYTSDNIANFDLMTFSVPISLIGWSLSGTIPNDMVKVYYRFDETDPFQELTQDAATSATSTLQLRIGVQLDSRRFVRDWYITRLQVHGIQA